MPRLLTALMASALLVGCDGSGPTALTEEVEVNFVFLEQNGDTVEMEIRVVNRGAQTLYLTPCYGVQRLVGMTWIDEPRLSGGCPSVPRTELDTDRFFATGARLTRDRVDPGEGGRQYYRITFELHPSSDFADDRGERRATRPFLVDW